MNESVDALEFIKSAVEILEDVDIEEGTRRWAELRLAYHHLMDAFSLIATGRLTPEAMVWASECAQRIIERAPADQTEERGVPERRTR